jgi:hypothetical protein
MLIANLAEGLPDCSASAVAVDAGVAVFTVKFDPAFEHAVTDEAGVPFAVVGTVSRPTLSSLNRTAILPTPESFVLIRPSAVLSPRAMY